MERNGFTLVETLVAIIVIVALVAIAVPVYKSVSSSGASVKCVANLRNIYQATLLFTQDFDGKLPPPQGPRTNIDDRFTFNAFWWTQGYLARYTIGPSDRLQDSRGQLRQDEVGIYNCPARLVEGPDSQYAHTNGNPGVSYVMADLPNNIAGHLLRTMENPSRKIFLTEGRDYVLRAATCKSGDLGSTDSSRRLRRYHNGALNILFYDGHVESFSGRDEELIPLLPQSSQ